MKTQKYGILPVVQAFTLLNFSLIFLLAGCWGSSSKDTASQKLVMINVLDPDYHQDCHMTGSINIPFEQFEDRMLSLNKKDKYVLYCSNHACTAAPFAATMLQDAGFEDVAIFPGGIVEWYQKGYPVTGNAQKGYLQEVNEILDEDGHPGVTEISADDLKAAMIQAGLI